MSVLILSFKDINDLRDIFYLLFSDKNDARWIDAVPLKTWRGVFGVLTRYTEQKDRERLKKYIESEGAICHRDAFNLDCS